MRASVSYVSTPGRITCLFRNDRLDELVFPNAFARIEAWFREGRTSLKLSGVQYFQCGFQSRQESLRRAFQLVFSRSVIRICLCNTWGRVSLRIPGNSRG